jgi:hypothetical protein
VYFVPGVYDYRDRKLSVSLCVFRALPDVMSAVNVSVCWMKVGVRSRRSPQHRNACATSASPSSLTPTARGYVDVTPHQGRKHRVALLDELGAPPLLPLTVTLALATFSIRCAASTRVGASGSWYWRCDARR